MIAPDTLRALAADQRVSLDPGARQFRIDVNVALVGAEWVPIASASTVELARSWAFFAAMQYQARIVNVHSGLVCGFWSPRGGWS